MISVDYLNLLMDDAPPDDRPRGHLQMPLIKQFCTIQTGRKYGQYSQDYRVLTQCQLELAERYPIDVFNVLGYPYREAGDCGLRVDFPPDAQPIGHGPLITCEDDLDQIVWPGPHQGRLMSDRIRAITEFKTRRPDMLAMGACESPFALATTFLGLQQALMCLYDDPALLERVIQWIEPHTIEFAIAQIEAGADMILMGDSIASQIGPQFYIKHALEPETRVTAAIQDRGVPMRLHICGDITPILDDVGRTGARMIDIDYAVDLAEACDRIGKVSPTSYVVGNFDPVTVLLQGSADDVRHVCRECERQASGFDHFILSPGCEVPPATPVENYQAMLEFGWKALIGMK